MGYPHVCKKGTQGLVSPPNLIEPHGFCDQIVARQGSETHESMKTLQTFDAANKSM
jgi:hypothetical protein